MASKSNLSGLVHELRLRIASSSDRHNDAALEARFQAVLPGLLHTHVLPSPQAKERDVIATLKLLYHGKPSVILPILARILPFLARPTSSAAQPTIFQALVSLLSLLRIGDGSAYRLFIFEIQLLLQSILFVLEDSSAKSFSLTCFSNSFYAIRDDPIRLSDLPQCLKPDRGHGILINLTDEDRWQPFATSLIRILCKYFAERTLYPNDFPAPSFVSQLCTMIIYGDTHLHMACFDFARIVGSVTSLHIVSEQVIRTVAIILSQDGEGFPIFK